MAVSRYYSSTAVSTALTAPVTNSATTITVGSVTGFPVQYPYTLSIDADNVNKELVEVTNAVGTTLTIVRAKDGTAGVTHSLGAAVSHDHSARDFRESREHEAATAAIHGVTGTLVGTGDTQVLTNKDLTSGTNTFPASLATDTELSTAVAAAAATAATNLATHTSNTSNPHSTTKTQVGLGNVDNTSDTAKPVSTAQATAIALKQDASTAVTLTGTQTLTNKTLTTPLLTTPLLAAALTQIKDSGGTARDSQQTFTASSKAGLPTNVPFGSLGLVTAGTSPALYFFDSPTWRRISAQGGTGSSGTVTANVAKSVRVDFPDPQYYVPSVTVSYQGANPSTRFVSIDSVDANGFSAWCINTASTTSVPFYWVASL